MIDDEYYQQRLNIIEENKHKLRSWQDFSLDIKHVFSDEEKIQ